MAYYYLRAGREFYGAINGKTRDLVLRRASPARPSLAVSSIFSEDFYFRRHFCATSANNASKGTDRSPGCQRLGATYRLKCLLSVADATRRTRTSSGRRHVVSSKASATGNFANARRRIVNGSLPFSSSLPFIYYSPVHRVRGDSFFILKQLLNEPRRVPNEKERTLRRIIGRRAKRAARSIAKVRCALMFDQLML